MVSENAAIFDNSVDQVFNCLDQGSMSSSWFESLSLNVKGMMPSKIAAIGIDTNVLKVLRRAPLNANSLLTYVEQQEIKLIIPAQSAHEYWNNHGVIVRDIDGVYKAVEDLQKKVSRSSVAEQQRAAIDDIQERLAQLAEELHDSKRPELLEESTNFWEEVLPKAYLCSVPRLRFKDLAEVRFASKTAPGFSDTKKGNQALGDFYVWADFLLGLLAAGLGSEAKHDERVVFVTDDEKPDWKASNGPHPVLMGELTRLTGRHLEIMGSNELLALVNTN